MGHDHEIDAPIAEGRIEVDPATRPAPGSTCTGRRALLAIVPGTEPEKDVPTVEERMRGPEVLDVDAAPWHPLLVVRDRGRGSGSSGRPLAAARARGPRAQGDASHRGDSAGGASAQGDEVVATGEAKLRLRRLGVEPPSVGGVVKVSNDFRLAFEIHARREGRRRAHPAHRGSPRRPRGQRHQVPLDHRGVRLDAEAGLLGDAGVAVDDRRWGCGRGSGRGRSAPRSTP